jgi:hypothetical protein
MSLSSFVEHIGYVSLINRIGFYCNERVCIVLSLRSGWA